MTSSIGNYSNVFSYSSISGSSASKLYVPVSQASLLYSHFDHVSGVAAKSGQSGVSISKIRILNSLVDRISAIKNRPSEKFSELSDKQADILIEHYQKQIQQAVSTPYILSGAQVLSGSLFAIDA